MEPKNFTTSPYICRGLWTGNIKQFAWGKKERLFDIKCSNSQRFMTHLKIWFSIICTKYPSYYAIKCSNFLQNEKSLGGGTQAFSFSAYPFSFRGLGTGNMIYLISVSYYVNLQLVLLKIPS